MVIFRPPDLSADFLEYACSDFFCFDQVDYLGGLSVLVADLNAAVSFRKRLFLSFRVVELHLADRPVFLIGVFSD